MCGFFLIMGVALVFVVLGLYYFRAVEMRGYLACGFLLISGGAFAFIDYDYITLLFDNAWTVNTVDFALQILVCTFLLMYLKSYFRTEKYVRVANRLFGGWVILASLYFVLRAMHVISFNDVPGHMVAILVALIAVGSYHLVRGVLYLQGKTDGICADFRFDLVGVYYSGIVELPYDQCVLDHQLSDGTVLFCIGTVLGVVKISVGPDCEIRTGALAATGKYEKGCRECTTGACSDAKSFP